MIRDIYQTLENRENADEVEKCGPFLCKRFNAWLGAGYYFWESFIENAHWWGNTYEKNGYFICKSKYNLDEKCFNLVDNPEHITYLKEIIKFLKKQGLIEHDKTTISRVLNYIKDELSFLDNYQSIRVLGLKSKSKSTHYSYTLPFLENKSSYIDLNPAIQICFFSKRTALLEDFHIIYPEEYIAPQYK